MRLRNHESVWKDASGGFVAEIRGLFDEDRGVHDWVRLGVYGSREAAEEAILDARDDNEDWTGSPDPGRERFCAD